MSGTGDTGQELPGKLPEKDDSTSESDNRHEATKEEVANQEVVSNETPSITSDNNLDQKNTEQKGVQEQISDTDDSEKLDTSGADEEKKESQAIATAIEQASVTDEDEKIVPKADVKEDLTSATNGDISEETALDADKKEELDKDEESSSTEDKLEAESNNEATAVAAEKPEKEDEFLDILGNGTLLKKILEKGLGDRPNMGDEVIVLMTKEIPEIEKVFPEEEITYVLGDGDVVQALDLSVALMNTGEKAMIIAGYKYMYGDLGLEPDIPPKSNFKLIVKLIASNGPLDYPTMTFSRRFEEAKKKKEMGNFMFKRKEFALALNSYTKASRILDPSLGCVFNDESPENLQQLLEFRAIVLTNSSAAQIKMEAYDSAVKSASEAARLMPSYHKAYLRLGQAQEKLGNTNETIKSYKQALKSDPDNSKWLHAELERLTKLNKKNKQTQQEMYSKMFWGANPPTMNKKVVIPKDASFSSWLWKTGATVVGAGLVGLAGIGIYRYMNH